MILWGLSLIRGMLQEITPLGRRQNPMCILHGFATKNARLHDNSERALATLKSNKIVQYISPILKAPFFKTDILTNYLPSEWYRYSFGMISESLLPEKTKFTPTPFL